jgi:sigma-B regulation protein RsbU (phosphoserine phosphatase)
LHIFIARWLFVQAGVWLNIVYPLLVLATTYTVLTVYYYVTEHLEKGRMDEELKIAHDIQMSMLPAKAPKIEGFTVAARCIPAREVGGDFYDFIEVRTNGTAERLGIVIGDVSGKAVSGALVMAASRSIFRILTETYASVEQLMAIANTLLNRDIKKGMFVALAYTVFYPQQKMLTLSNAGQTQPILCPGDKSKPVYIDTPGDKFPLGILKKCRYQETQVPLNPGDTLVFYTDGVVEAMNNKRELYGFERFMTSIERGRELDADALLEKLMDDVARYAGDSEQHDDLTIVVVKVE